MPAKPSSPEIPLPRGWPSCVKTAILHVISLAQFGLAYTRGWAANSCASQEFRPRCLVRTYVFWEDWHLASG